MSLGTTQRPAARHEGRSLRQEDDAVSPVVGMILVLAISIVGIAAILYWGLPAIDEMKANVEHRSIESQFVELDASIKELVAGTTEKTAKRWQPSLNRGSVLVSGDSEGWLYATELYNASSNIDLIWDNLSDGNNTFTITTNGTTLNQVKIEAYQVRGTTTLDELNVTVSSAPSTWRAKMSYSNLTTWQAGTTQLFRVYNSTGSAVNLRGATFMFKVWTGSDLVAQAWYVNTGRVDYQLAAGVGTKYVIENNGAVLTGSDNGFLVSNTPPIPPQANTSGVHRFFARAVVLNGTGSFGGEDRFDVLASLYSTATLASYDCATISKTTCVESSKIFVYGTYREPWYAYLTNSARGYDFARQTWPGSGTSYLLDREGYMGYTLLQSNVLLTTSG